MKVILSYGMGVDSTAILMRWIHEPESRDFDLEDLVVITAMVGDEFDNTRRVVETHLLPLLRKHGIRYVQIARYRTEAEGIAILDDSTCPETLHIEGVYKLSDELAAAATVPQYASGRRTCSVKYKGVPLDTWIAREMGSRSFRHVMGFNADEGFRVERDSSYSNETRQSEYPLVEWGWGRQKCEDYLADLVGEAWPKSCCKECPFAGGKSEAMDRYQSDPTAAVMALWLEHMSLAMNPRMGLYSGKTLRDSIGDNPEALRLFEDRLASVSQWSLYRIRRAYTAKGKANRSLEVVATDTRSQVRAQLAGIGQVVELEGSERVFTRTRTEDTYPTAEEMFVVAPSGVSPKESQVFGINWVRATEADDARARGEASPDPAVRAAHVVRELVEASRSFTQGEIASEASVFGVTQEEAVVAFRALADAGEIRKDGRRYVKAHKPVVVVVEEPKEQARPVEQSSWKRSDFVVPTYEAVCSFHPDSATNVEIYQEVCGSLGLQEEELGVQESSGKLWTHFWIARALRDLRDKDQSVVSPQRGIWAKA